MSLLVRRLQGLSLEARPRAAVRMRAFRGIASTPRWASAPAQATAAAVSVDASVSPVAPALEASRQARQLLRWLWLNADQRHELTAYVDAADQTAAPAWLPATYHAARQYRTARSRRWLPDAERVGGRVDAFLRERIDAMRARLEGGAAEGLSLEMWEAMSLDEQADVVLLPVWARMTEEERSAALTRVTYECARRLGWRSGYSAGYPGAGAPPAVGRAPGSRTAARRALQATEEARAWDAWQALTPEERRAEWETAWRLRDRSVVYVDEAPTTRLLGAPAPRWFAEPQRAGALQFLPNVTVRLVRNHTPRGQPYDAWKATFRVPLHMDKHQLRSFLLAVYGLRTTWARSMVYRSSIVFSGRQRRRVVGKDRTFKKVEVGLLEPFVFPGVTKDFLRVNLFQQEMMYEERRLLLKMTKGRRWRSHKSVRDLSRALDRDWAAQSAGAPDEAPTERPTAQLLVRKRSVPTARHGNILSVLAERRAEREARLQTYLDEQRQKSAPSS